MHNATNQIKGLNSNHLEKVLRSNLLCSTERKLFNPSIPVNNQANKKYDSICKLIQIIYEKIVKL